MIINLLKEEDGVKFVEVCGTVDQQQVSPLVDPLADAFSGDVYSGNVLLNLAKTDSLDSSGVGWLLGCHKRFRQSGGKMVLYSLSTMVGNTLRVLNMHMVFKIAKNEQAAVELMAKLRGSTPGAALGSAPNAQESGPGLSENPGSGSNSGED